MNDGAKVALSFITGGIFGAIVGYFINKKLFENKYLELINNLNDNENVPIDTCHEENKSTSPIVKSSIDIEALKNSEITNYSAIANKYSGDTELVKPMKKPGRPRKNGEPHVIFITDNEFNFDDGKVLIYHQDSDRGCPVLSDEGNECDHEWIKKYLGNSIYKQICERLGSCVESELFVRNQDMGIDYNVIYSLTPYLFEDYDEDEEV